MSGLTGVRHADPCTCERCCRKAAFGAIRRAAAVARQFDHDAELLRQRCHSIIDGKDVGDIALLNRYNLESKNDAAIVRRAIRAAIGSEKA